MLLGELTLGRVNDGVGKVSIGGFAFCFGMGDVAGGDGVGVGVENKGGDKLFESLSLDELVQLPFFCGNPRLL